ncbi:hypothetical protein ACFVIM_17300 [Streptomyces sp. NPDC057638]|uniref:hypothetical protein n=1 Tax=Streptomyces sp. NPDC057638 TaxID=3346190 RepID=UPI003690A08B
MRSTRCGVAWLGSSLLLAIGAAPVSASVAADGARPVASAVVSTSPAAPPPSAVGAPARAAAAGEEVITFSEFPEGTAIERQYRPRGIVFSGAGGGGTPFISPDAASPTAPVLSGSPLFEGGIQGRFVRAGGAGRTVGQFSLTVGYINEPNSVVVNAYNRQGKRIAGASVDRTGIVPVTVKAKGIAFFRVLAAAGEPAGFAIDNVRYAQPRG